MTNSMLQARMIYILAFKPSVSLFQFMPTVPSHLVKSIAAALSKAAGDDRVAAEKAAEEVLAIVRSPKHVCIAFFALPEPIRTVRVYAVALMSSAVLANDMVQANQTACLRNVISFDSDWKGLVQLEFEGLDAYHNVVATAPGIFLGEFITRNDLTLLAPIATYQVDAIPIRYSAIIESYACVAFLQINTEFSSLKIERNFEAKVIYTVLNCCGAKTMTELSKLTRRRDSLRCCCMSGFEALLCR